MGNYLRSVINYSYNRYNLHLSELVKTLFTIKTNEDLTSRISTLEKAMKTPNFRLESQLLSGYICAYNLISPSFCKNGKGWLYVFNEKFDNLSKEKVAEAGTMYNELITNAYQKAYNSVNEKIDLETTFNIERILTDELKLEGVYEKLEIQSMYRYIHLNKNYSELIEAMLS